MLARLSSEMICSLLVLFYILLEIEISREDTSVKINGWILMLMMMIIHWFSLTFILQRRVSHCVLWWPSPSSPGPGPGPSYQDTQNITSIFTGLTTQFLVLSVKFELFVNKNNTTQHSWLRFFFQICNLKWKKGEIGWQWHQRIQAKQECA